MTWLDDDMGELRRRKESEAELKVREREIASLSGTAYNDLWDEIIEVLKEATSKGLPELDTDGSSYARTIIVPGKPTRAERFPNPKEYLLKLAKNQQSLSFVGPDLNIALLFDLCEDNVLRIRHDGEHKDPKDIARFLLRPLLFPDLFGPK